MPASDLDMCVMSVCTHTYMHAHTNKKNTLKLKATHVMCDWKEEYWDEKKQGEGRGRERR